ncbi:hypothetical protein LTR84_004570 [Exophiala bonariae]|uniref:RGS domain-containing protein n=1 Tax=Exophiala bonariae TaxID=1690606 RepID=A0AAV9NMR2_9EURO|nr:hypothetical protein LTR84_004570 [Exophiala bonariae]
MDPPVVPLSRTRLTRDYTFEDDMPPATAVKSPPAPKSVEGTQGTSTPRPSYHEGRSESSRSNDGRSSALRSQAPESPHHSRESSDIRSLETATPTGQMEDKGNLEELRKLDFNLDPIEETDKSAYEPSISTFSRTSHNTTLTVASSNKLPDFFAQEVFQIVLHNPTTSHQLLKYSQSRLCGENLEFLEKVTRYNNLLSEVAKNMFDIHRNFISVNSPNQINISENVLVKVNRDLKSALTTTLPKLESVFVDSQNSIERLVADDVYPKFVRHQMTMSAAKALAGDRGKYAGLGDCFVLSDPIKADNPIVYASDGFVKVTGYARNEIIPRNCRFLQGRQTDPASVKRLREAISSREEIVELLLNQKKSGEPFWNLLYMTPLFDATGNVVFFLGGQINCSTTVHNQSDVLRILAMSNDTDEKAVDGVLAPEIQKTPSRASKFLANFRSKSGTVEAHRMPGMEDKLLNKMETEKMNLRRQMDTFYTAYSKFLVINYSTFYISFHSAGAATLLYPARPIPNSSISQIVGMDIFRWLSVHSASKVSSEYKSRVRTALKMGNAVSLDLTMCTRRFMGFEKFATHWTPLKNEAGEIAFVILTLGGFQD